PSPARELYCFPARLQFDLSARLSGAAVAQALQWLRVLDAVCVRSAFYFRVSQDSRAAAVDCVQCRMRFRVDRAILREDYRCERALGDSTARYRGTAGEASPRGRTAGAAVERASASYRISRLPAAAQGVIDHREAARRSQASVGRAARMAYRRR